MAERDYFDIPDDPPRTPEPIPMPLAKAAPQQTYADESMEIPREKHHGASANIIAVLVFLLIIGGCVLMILRQMHMQNLK